MATRMATPHTKAIATATATMSVPFQKALAVNHSSSWPMRIAPSSRSHPRATGMSRFHPRSMSWS